MNNDNSCIQPILNKFPKEYCNLSHVEKILKMIEYIQEEISNCVKEISQEEKKEILSKKGKYSNLQKKEILASLLIGPAKKIIGNFSREEINDCIYYFGENLLEKGLYSIVIAREIKHLLIQCSYEDKLAILQIMPNHLEVEKSKHYTENYLASANMLQSAVFEEIDFSNHTEEYIRYYPNKIQELFVNGQSTEFATFDYNLKSLIKAQFDPASKLSDKNRDLLQKKFWDKLKDKIIIDIGCGKEPYVAATLGALAGASQYVGIDFRNIPKEGENLILSEYSQAITNETKMKIRIIKDCFENFFHPLPKDFSPVILLSGLEFIENFGKIYNYLDEAQPGTIVILAGTFGNLPGIGEHLDGLSRYKKIRIFPKGVPILYEKMTEEEYTNLKKLDCYYSEKKYEEVILPTLRDINSVS